MATKHYDTSFLKTQANGQVVMSNYVEDDEGIVAEEPGPNPHPNVIPSSQVTTGSGFSGTVYDPGA